MPKLPISAAHLARLSDKSLLAWQMSYGRGCGTPVQQIEILWSEKVGANIQFKLYVA